MIVEVELEALENALEACCVFLVEEVDVYDRTGEGDSRGELVPARELVPTAELLERELARVRMLREFFRARCERCAGTLATDTLEGCTMASCLIRPPAAPPEGPTGSDADPWELAPVSTETARVSGSVPANAQGGDEPKNT